MFIGREVQELLPFGGAELRSRNTGPVSFRSSERQLCLVAV